MNTKRILCIQPDLYCVPLVLQLRNSDLFDVRYDVPSRNAIALRERNADAVFLTTIDYGRDSSDYEVIARVALSSRQPNDTVTLHFRQNLKRIRSIAVDPSSISEILLAKIILAEQFGSEPQIVPLAASLEEMLGRADAALLVGDASLRHARTRTQKLDLVDFWIDMTGLPYVHGFWCFRDEGLDTREMTAIQAAAAGGLGQLRSMMDGDVRIGGSVISDGVKEGLISSLSYDLDEEAVAAISEFLRFAYYHGALPDVPDLHITSSQPDDSAPDTISSN